VSMTDRLREDQNRTAAEQRQRELEAAARAAQARERMLARVEESRENRIGIAVLLLVLSLLAFGGGGIMVIKNRRKPAIILGGSGAALLLASVIVFFTRPSLTDAEAPTNSAEATAKQAAAASFAGRNVCRLVGERSRVTVSSTQDVPLEWTDSGCVNRRTQYARNGDTWTRVLVPGSEQAVSVLQFKPASGEYVVTRYLLGAQAMERVRALRRNVDVKACTADPEARTVLADQLRDINTLLPRLPDERLVYRCRHEGPAAAPAQGSNATG
jgi:hypothetical protein